MLHARPSFATINFYCFQYLLRKPVLILALVTFSLFILLHQYYSEYSTYSHNAKLIRRNTSNHEYFNEPIKLHNQDKSISFIYTDHRNSDTDNQAHSYQVDDILSRIENLKKIKYSISNELRLIEREKAKLLREKASLSSRNDKLLAQIAKSKAQLKQLELDISANRRRKFEQTCDINRVSPILFKPLQSLHIEQFSISTNESQINTDPDDFKLRHSSNPFDLSLCPLTSEFKFHINVSLREISKSQTQKIDPELINLVVEILQAHHQYTSSIDEACLQITILVDDSPITLNSSLNNLIINLAGQDSIENLKSRPINSAIASPVFSSDGFHDNFDLILPSLWKAPNNYESIVGSTPPQSPIERKYLASYFGRAKSSPLPSALDDLNPLEKTLQIIHRNSIDDLFLFIYNCGPDSNIQCYDEREKMIELSTYLIILPPTETNLIDEYTNDLIYLALSRGSIPVIIGKEKVRLPFDEVIDWRRATILIHSARLPEMHFILRSISPADLYQLKYHGRRIYENYLATAKQILDTIISVMSLERFNYPPPPVQGVKTNLYQSDGRLALDSNCTSDACLEAKTDSMSGLLAPEILGPRERALASQSYRRNLSLVLNSAYDLWNNPIYSPHRLFPAYPIDPVLPSEYKFLSPDQGFRPIGEGLGGSGYEFSRALGGDYSNEQFTIILLTYERKAMLMKTLERLKGLSYLNKILVVWNGVKHEPTDDLIWPDVGVPIKVVKVARNSLNNRFLPFDEIETDAVLSLDDDSPLRPDEIVFAFRVWRQSRDRIVGFPGRYHAWDATQNAWMYNSNHSCELSMVLTGGAFFHKYYSYIYTFSMPSAIRSIVDKFMNCEDIAMNFLVAHLIRKPPIKVTSRWTFHCANCPSSLSEDDSHFRERHECLNTFTSIYGYMPLLSTQHRADSVLFKTRIPHDKQKCFKYV